MRTVNRPFDPKFHREKFPRVVDPPDWCFGMETQWDKEYQAELTYIGSYADMEAAKELLVCGAKFELSRAQISSLGRLDGFVLGFFVFEVSQNDFVIHRLFQHECIAFTEEGAESECLPANEISKTDIKRYSLAELPAWRKSAADWPLYHGELMTFVTQFYLPASKAVKEYLSAGIALFLFQTEKPEGSVYKIMLLDTDQQFVEDHYDAEK